MADAIGLHLENVRMSQANIRTEELAKGLTDFVKDHADFDPQEASNHGRLQSSVHAANHLPHESAATTANADDSDSTPVLGVPLVHVVQCVSPESPRSSFSTVTGEESVFFLQDQHCMTEPLSLNSVTQIDQWC
ncbi:hypothetical protein PENFLA_c060G10245 [Penicillium flavigenum]|uniref:Uncharacterized protein n=1 Tax=Penicillium flavigenum TaxID=254877 RepID=A0A1V6SFV2_9EURO|nr:hypothetical protein PENFLA_c060G10245 [Penicillium flavigenum]